MKISIASATLALCLLGEIASARDKDWFARRMTELDQTLRIEEPATRIGVLGNFLQIGSYGGMDDEQRKIFDRTQTALLAIPGHAKYYQDRIESLRAQALENEKKPKEERNRMQAAGTWIDLGVYEDFRLSAFSVLELLPSPETVAVLGHFLNDPESRDGRNMFGERIEVSDVRPFPPNCAAAYLTIVNLGIENSPASLPKPRFPGDYNLDNVDTWKDWWNEVKTGKRTYRFQGSSIEYGADGPATKEQLERISMHQRMESERAARHGKKPGVSGDDSPAADAPVSRKPATYAIIAAALALLVSGVWHFRRANAAR